MSSESDFDESESENVKRKIESSRNHEDASEKKAKHAGGRSSAITWSLITNISQPWKKDNPSTLECINCNLSVKCSYKSERAKNHLMACKPFRALLHKAAVEGRLEESYPEQWCIDIGNNVIPLFIFIIIYLFNYFFI